MSMDHDDMPSQTELYVRFLLDVVDEEQLSALLLEKQHELMQLEQQSAYDGLYAVIKRALKFMPYALGCVAVATALNYGLYTLLERSALPLIAHITLGIIVVAAECALFLSLWHHVFGYKHKLTQRWSDIHFLNHQLVLKHILERMKDSSHTR